MFLNTTNDLPGHRVFSGRAGFGAANPRFNGCAGKFRPIFRADFADTGSGQVSLALGYGAGSATFTRASTAYTVGSDGLLLSVATGVPRSYYDPVSLGYYGYLAEVARTNNILQSNTLGTTWTVSNAADMNAVSADQYVAPDGTTTMDLLQPKNTTAVHSLDQAFTFTAAQYTTSAYLRYVSATPQRWVALILNDGMTTWGASFDISLGVVGAVSAGATSTIEATGQANVYRVSVTNTANAAAAAGTVKISLNATDTATLESAARVGTETLGVWGVQHEVGPFMTSYIPTTTIAVARNVDVLTYPFAVNISNTVGSAYAEVSTIWSTSESAASVIASDGSSATNYALGQRNATAATTIDISDATNALLSNTFTSMKGVMTKVVSSWGLPGLAITGAGKTATTGSFDNTLFAGSTLLTIGHGGLGTQPWNGTIRNVRIWDRPLPNSELKRITK